eukprot:GHVT01063492.1.p3 GENE.GHVT01063492.1~~GHVT01063492.1.p3  ORF type:complete len:167 (+),score=11.61 GHVT01063492.1:2808-3308(+)
MRTCVIYALFCKLATVLFKCLSKFCVRQLYTHLSFYSASFPIYFVIANAQGDAKFCLLLSAAAQPCGGLRIWCKGDAIPGITKLVGYHHAGVPIELAAVSPSCVGHFSCPARPSTTRLSKMPALVASHTLYQIGPVVHTFPVMHIQQVLDDIRSRLSSRLLHEERE